jgi:hydrogenase maturation protease
MARRQLTTVFFPPLAKGGPGGVGRQPWRPDWPGASAQEVALQADRFDGRAGESPGAAPSTPPYPPFPRGGKAPRNRAPLTDPSIESCQQPGLPVLVIGYGNTLRRDDGAGCLVADEVRSWARPNVRALSVFQLTPELADDLSSSQMAIFVDARVDAPSAGVRVEEVVPLDEGAVSLVHGITPRSLLRLSLALFGRCPPGWLVSIPAEDFSHGEGLSPLASEGVRSALGAVAALLDPQTEPNPILSLRVLSAVTGLPRHPPQDQESDHVRPHHPG